MIHKINNVKDKHYTYLDLVEYCSEKMIKKIFESKKRRTAYGYAAFSEQVSVNK